MIPRILAIAGSDSGGGAGIQADIKTITMLGGHAMTAITAITAQNTLGVDAVLPVPAEMVLAQIDAVARDIGIDAVKIGMIGSAETALMIAERLDPKRAGHEQGAPIRIVVDPVMVASSGAVLADDQTIAALEKLMKRATLITPNLPELEVLTGRKIDDVDGMRIAAEDLARRTGAAVLAKGGHLEGDVLWDVLITRLHDLSHETSWSSERIATRHTHGTGCTLSSAIATESVREPNLAIAIERARMYVRSAIEAAPELGAGHGPMGHGLGRAHFPD